MRIEDEQFNREKIIQDITSRHENRGYEITNGHVEMVVDELVADATVLDFISLLAENELYKYHRNSSRKNGAL